MSASFSSQQNLKTSSNNNRLPSQSFSLENIKQRDQEETSLRFKRSFSALNTSTTPTTTVLQQPLQKMKAEEQQQSLYSLVQTTPHEKLEYSIYDHSSHSGSYHPRNICVNDPTEQSSRWSSGSHDQSQFIIIKLDKPAVACKFH
jgi:hypothetical protein